ncbi:MAG: PAS domain-containing protein [Candidatus Protistobacter heckmanni]|nr:PAS domain-containing protein [Candidatus Protistobacter heckmanni]
MQLPDSSEYGVFDTDRAVVLGNLRGSTYARMHAVRQAAGPRMKQSLVAFDGADDQEWVGVSSARGDSLPTLGHTGWLYVIALPAATLEMENTKTTQALLRSILVPVWLTGVGCWLLMLFYATRLQRFLASLRNLESNQTQKPDLRWMPAELVKLRAGLSSLLAGLRRRELELQRAYEELAESFRGVSSSFPGMFCSGILSQGRPAYAYLSASAETYLGVPAEWILQDGNFFLTNIPAQDRGQLMNTMAEAFKVDGPLSVTFRATCSDGELRWLCMVVTVRYDRDGHKYFDAIGIDISPIMQAEDQAAEAYREAEKLRIQAEQANTAKSTFLVNMSHELRTPLNGIIGFATLIEEETRDAGLREKTRNIREMGDMLHVILNDILDYSKIEASRLQLEQQAFSLNTELQSLTDIFRMQAMQKGLSFRETIPQAMPMVICDPLRLRQVPGDAQPGLQRGEIHVRWRHRARRGGAPGQRPDPCALRSARHGHGHFAGIAAPSVRALRASRDGDAAALRWNGPGAADLQVAGQSDGRGDRRGLGAGQGQHLLGGGRLPAGGGRGAGRLEQAAGGARQAGASAGHPGGGRLPDEPQADRGDPAPRRAQGR